MITYTTKKDAARNKIAFNPCTTQHEIGRDVKCFAVVQALVLWRRNHFLQRPPFASNLDLRSSIETIECAAAIDLSGFLCVHTWK